MRANDERHERASGSWWRILGGPRERSRREELLDDPRVDDETRLRALRDVERANAYFGGTRLVLRELWATLGSHRQWVATVLDVGTGTGDIPRHARERAKRDGNTLTVIAVDLSEALARAAHHSGSLAVCSDAVRLPLADRSVDIAICSQLLHHFHDDDIVTVFRELDRVARRRVIICDLRRSWIAAGGFWLSARALGFHAISRHDGLVSILRGFTRAELSSLVHDAVGRTPLVRRRLGFRLVASWDPL